LFDQSGDRSPLFTQSRPSRTIRWLPDFAEIRRQLQTHKHLTLQLVWESTAKPSPTATATADTLWLKVCCDSEIGPLKTRFFVAQSQHNFVQLWV
jgi:hypothetical protein